MDAALPSLECPLLLLFDSSTLQTREHPRFCLKSTPLRTLTLPSAALDTPALNPPDLGPPYLGRPDPGPSCLCPPDLGPSNLCCLARLPPAVISLALRPPLEDSSLLAPRSLDPGGHCRCPLEPPSPRLCTPARSLTIAQQSRRLRCCGALRGPQSQHSRCACRGKASPPAPTTRSPP